MTKWINLPGNSRPTTLAKVSLQELKAKSVLINNSTVMCGCLVIHTPTTKNELQPTYITTSPPQSHLGRVCRYPSWLKMDSSTSCARCAISTADKSSYTAQVHYIHTMISHQSVTHRSLTVTFTITLILLTILIPLQPPASILQA